MEALLRARTTARRALGLKDRLPWWERPTSAHSKFQLAMAVTLVTVSVGLPMSWNHVVRSKWDAHRERKAAEAAAAAARAADDFASGRDSFAGLNERERVAVERAVNERRLAAGKAPWPYEAQRASAAASAWERGMAAMFGRPQATAGASPAVVDSAGAGTAAAAARRTAE